jgi:hypothetical protein
MISINPNMYPKGGYVFKESDGTSIVGSTWEGVVARVARYRQRAGLPAGDPTAEVYRQACANNPGLCTNDNGQYTKQMVTTSLKVRILSWLRNVLNDQSVPGRLEFVGEEERRNRAAICAKCPKNGSLPTGCQSCNSALEEIRKKIIGSRFHDARLQGCETLGEYLPVSTHLVSQTVENGELPGNCWRKRTL